MQLLVFQQTVKCEEGLYTIFTLIRGVKCVFKIKKGGGCNFKRP